MKALFRTLSQLWSLLVGLAVTGRYFLSRDVTVYYPRETVAPELLESFRGPIELVGLDDDPSTPRCISCMLCVQACSSSCIKVARSPAPKPTPEQQKAMDEAAARGEKVKKPAAPKNPGSWIYDYSLCSLCGICVETCPVDSIRFSSSVYLAGTARENFQFDLLARLRRLAANNAAERAATAPQSGPASRPEPETASSGGAA